MRATTADTYADTWNTYCAKLEAWRQQQREIAARRAAALARVPNDPRVPRTTAEATFRTGAL